MNINVDGQAAGVAVQGFGQMWQKTYSVRDPRRAGLRDDVMPPGSASSRTFWPKGNDFYAPLTGIEPGDVALLDMTPARER